MGPLALQATTLTTRPCLVTNNALVLGWERAWELQVLLTKPKLGSLTKELKPRRWAATYFKEYRLKESLDYVPHSLQVTSAKWSPRILAP